MFSVPFPVITLLALLLLLATVFSGKQRHNGTLRFLLACSGLISLNTLRWEYDSDMLRNIQSVLAIFLPAVAWHSFVPPSEGKEKPYLLVLLVPIVLSLLIRLVWPPATDFILVALFSGYGFGLLRTGWRREDPVTVTRLHGIPRNQTLAFSAGCFLCLSALTDLIIAFDFGISDGKHVTLMIVIAQLMLLPVIGRVIPGLVKTPERPDAVVMPQADATQTNPPLAEMSELYRKLEKQVYETQIYLNPDLTLALLARKTGTPARHFSAAVNSVKHCNVSQWINGFRIERAKELLLSTSLPVTDIMMESGFMTKSNFNREFQRLSGISPTLFRQQALDNPVLNSEKT